MKLIATRSDGAELYLTRTEIRPQPFGEPESVDMGVIVVNGVAGPEKEIMNLSKFNIWDFIEEN